MLHHVVTLARDPYHLSVVAKTPPPETGHSPNRAFFAWRSATRLGFRLGALSLARSPEPSRCLAGRRRSSLLLSSSDGAPGVHHTLRRFDPSAGWTRRNACVRVAADSREHTVVLIRVDISARPDPRAVRASASAPIDFRRGDRSPVGVTGSAKAVGRGCGWRRLLGFDSRLRSAPSALVWLTKRSCLGLCLLQGCRAHFAVHRPGSTPLPITNPRSADGKLIRRRRFLSAHGLCRRSFPSRGSCHPARAAAGMLLIA